MSIKIDGIDNLLNKLNNLSHIETKKVINTAAKDIENAIKNKAKKISDTSYLYVGQVEERSSGLSYFVDVGFSNKNADFELWKSLWFQNWGYFDYGWNFSGQIYVKKHQLWFNETIESQKKNIQKKIKEKLRQEVRNALR